MTDLYQQILGTVLPEATKPKPLPQYQLTHTPTITGSFQYAVWLHGQFYLTNSGTLSWYSTTAASSLPAASSTSIV